MQHVSLRTACARRTAISWLRFVRHLLWGVFLIAFCAESRAQGANDPYDGNWHFSITPYLWLPTINGTVRFRPPPGATGSPTFHFSVSPIDLLSHLDFGLMGTAELRKNNWSVFTDLIYLKLSGADTLVRTITGPGGIVAFPVDLGTEFGLKSVIWTFAPSYTVYRTSAASLDLFAGFRDAQFKPSLEWRFAGPLNIFPQTGSFSDTIVIWDALIGAKGRIALSEDGKWFAPYYADIGTGSKAFTWQALVGVGYAFPWGDLRLDYRALYYSPEKDVFLKHQIMHGPALTANFHF